MIYHIAPLPNISSDHRSHISYFKAF